MTVGLLLFYQILDYGEPKSLVYDALSNKVMLMNGGHFLNTQAGSRNCAELQTVLLYTNCSAKKLTDFWFKEITLV